MAEEEPGCAWLVAEHRFVINATTSEINNAFMNRTNEIIWVEHWHNVSKEMNEIHGSDKTPQECMVYYANSSVGMEHVDQCPSLNWHAIADLGYTLSQYPSDASLVVHKTPYFDEFGRPVGVIKEPANDRELANTQESANNPKLANNRKRANYQRSATSHDFNILFKHFDKPEGEAQKRRSLPMVKPKPVVKQSVEVDEQTRAARAARKCRPYQRISSPEIARVQGGFQMGERLNYESNSPQLISRYKPPPRVGKQIRTKFHEHVNMFLVTKAIEYEAKGTRMSLRDAWEFSRVFGCGVNPLRNWFDNYARKDAGQKSYDVSEYDYITQSMTTTEILDRFRLDNLEIIGKYEFNAPDVYYGQSKGLFSDGFWAGKSWVGKPWVEKP